MAKDFTAQVDKWVAKTERRLNAVVKESVERLIRQANTAGPSVANPGGGEGGRMPVDTGFLRASMAIGVNGMPAGPSRGSPDQTYTGSEGYSLSLASVQFGQTIYAGWTASYAIHMEARYGFARSAAQNWPQIVYDVTREAMARFP